MFGSISRSRGMSLIEVLVAIVVLSTGLLGMVALQAKALRNNQSSLERTEAVLFTYSILDRMRANPSGAYAHTLGGGTPSGTDLASTDIAAWLNAMTAALGTGADGSIVCAAGACTITVQWNDQRGITVGSSTQNLTTKTTL